MKHHVASLLAACSALLIATGCKDAAPLEKSGSSQDVSLVGAWSSQIHFNGGVLGAVPDLEFLYASDRKKRLKDSESGLDAQVYARYPKLTEAEVNTLVVDEKWLAALNTSIHSDMDRVSQQLTQRIRTLAERYETSLPQMHSRVGELEVKANQHLEKMGFAWE